MADSKISALPAFTGSVAAGDLFAIVDVSATTTKKIAFSALQTEFLQDLSEVLAQGNTTGANDIIISAGSKVKSPDGTNYITISDNAVTIVSNTGDDVTITCGDDFTVSAQDDISLSSANESILMNGSGITMESDATGGGGGYGMLQISGQVITGIVSPDGVATTGEFIFGPSSFYLQHDTKIEFDSAAVKLTQLTASTVPYLDASKNLVSSAVTPTQLSYLDATSSIQTQLNTKATIPDVYFIFPILSGVLNPIDSETYYTGVGQIPPSTSVGTVDFNIGYKCTLIGLVVTVSANTTAGTNENITVQLRNNTAATSHSIGTFQSNGGSATNTATFTFTGLNFSIAAGDSIAIQFDTPAWATNPQGTRWNAYLILARAV